MGVLGIALGAFQLVGSEGSWAYPYTTTDYGSPSRNSRQPQS